MITLSDVSKRFGDHVVLSSFSLSLAPGTVTAVLGPNGSGKTTLGRLLLGLEAPSSGELSGLDGVSRAAVFQDNRLVEHLTAVGNVRLVLPRAFPRPAVASALREVGLDDESLTVPVRQLSGGQRRRVALVRGLLPEASLVVLDEPFTGLDTQARALAVSWTRERLAGRTGLLITHELSDVDAFGATVVRLSGTGGGGA